MGAGHRHGISDFHRRVLALECASSRGRQATEVSLARTLKRERRFVVRRPARVTAVEGLNPWPAVVPQRRVVVRHEDWRDAIAIQRSELLCHPLNNFSLTPKLVQLLV